MEAFGRTIALVTGMVGVVFLLLFSKAASVRWQQHEIIRSRCNAFAEKIMYEKRILTEEWEFFLDELLRWGGYGAELTVYERRRFEDGNGGFYLYQRTELTEDRILKEGSYVRIVAMPKEDKKRDGLLSEDYGIIVAGGCIQ